MILFKGPPNTVIYYFVFSILLALVTGYATLSTPYRAVKEGSDPLVAVKFLLLVLVFSALFLLAVYLLKKWVKILVLAVEIFFLWATSTLLFSLLFEEITGLVWGLLLPILRIFLPNRTRNLSAAVIAGVASGFVGVSLEPSVAVLLYALLVLYDFFSVFVSGHMVEMVKSVEDVGAKEGKEVVLGGGDVVVPSLLAASFLPDTTLSLVSAIGALVGVTSVFWFLKRFKVPLPALPYIGAYQLSLIALSLFLSTLLP